MRTDEINLKICGEMPCLVNKLKDLKKQHPVSNHEKDFFPTEPRQSCGFLCFFCVLSLCLGGRVRNHSFPWSSPPLCLHNSLSKCLKAFLLFLDVETNFCFLCQCLVTPAISPQERCNLSSLSALWFLFLKQPNMT